MLIIPHTDNKILFFLKSLTNADAVIIFLPLNVYLYKPTIILSEYSPYCTDAKKLEN
jgi:hypothetical protein